MTKAHATVRVRAAWAVGIAGFFLATSLLLQWLSGAYSAELAGHPDEPAHYVTGLMVRDYLETWPPIPPVRFAENFYVHYPKMALGHWPPFFYLLQAAWTIPFSASRASVLILMAVLAAALAFSVYRSAAAEYGRAVGAGFGLLLLLLPAVQKFTGMVMTEIPVALLCFMAAVRFGRYVANERRQDALWFGIFSALAIMTKGSGLALALVPPLTLAFARRFDLLRRGATWVPAGVVAAICGPWYALTYEMQSQGWAETGDEHFLLRSFPSNVGQFLGLLGPVLFALAAVGFAVKVVRPWRAKRVDPKWAAPAALVVSVWIFQSLVPAGLEIRHLMAATGAAALLAAAGAAWVTDRIRTGRMSAYTASIAAALTIALLFGATTFAIPKKPNRGYSAIVRDILSRPQFARSIILVSSQFEGEGAVISEFARRERRPGHIILRASKVLAQSEWNGANYRVLFPDADAVMRAIDGVPVGLLIMDNTPGTKDHTHHRQLEQVLRKYPDEWELLAAYPNDVRVYRLRGHEGRAHGKIRIDLEPMLGRSVEFDPGQ